MADFEWGRLRRQPDAEADNLYASDAADRLIVDTAASVLPGLERGDVVVIGDSHGALTLAIADAAGESHRVRQPRTGGHNVSRVTVSGTVRAHQDAVIAEQALAANAERFGLAGAYRSLPLDADLVRGARLILLRLPKSLDALDELAGIIAAHADPDVTVIAGGMQKHMTVGMNDVLTRYFARIDLGHARQKARVLTVTGPLSGVAGTSAASPTIAAAAAAPGGAGEVAPSTEAAAAGGGRDAEHSVTNGTAWPRRRFHADIAPGLWVCAHGGAFAGTRIDIGTRFLLDQLDEAAPRASVAVDLACGTGVLATTLALRRASVRVIASDQSAAATASAAATVRANGVAGRVEVRRENAGDGIPDACADLVLLNPPFHNGAALDLRIGRMLVAAAARLLAPGGELWTVYNSHLDYKPVLRRLVGATRQVDRNAKFTVTASTKR